MSEKKSSTIRGNRRHSQLSQQILVRYILSVLGLLAGFALLFFLGWLFCRLFIWQSYDPLYRFLKAMEDTVHLWGTALILIGVCILTYRFISKPLDYLDEVILAAEQLAQPDEQMIRLSPAMVSIQDELNIVRESALRSAMHAREAEQRKNDLIVYLAHDLKTPLTSVIGYLHLLRDEPQISPEMRARYTGIALEKAQRLEALINEFFEITRFNLSQLMLESEEIDLTRMLSQIAFEFQPLFEEKALQWDLQLCPDVVLLCDPDKLERVFDNLIRNAANYSYRDTTVHLSLKHADGMAIITIENHGKTLPPEQLQRIFQHFYRIDSARSSSSGGAGLGLAIAKEIVELHGGQITAQSQEERIIFTVTLPLTPQKGS